MATKRPIANYDGKLKELSYSDTLPGSLALTEFEANLGSTPRYSGSFDITGLSGLTPDKQVILSQKAAPYTGKGTLYDEIEMDPVYAFGYVLDSTTVRVYWKSDRMNGPVAGNVKFGYQISL